MGEADCLAATSIHTAAASPEPGPCSATWQFVSGHCPTFYIRLLLLCWVSSLFFSPLPVIKTRWDQAAVIAQVLMNFRLFSRCP